jgi:DNA uptake protein ComE-like DNA-binding protein
MKILFAGAVAVALALPFSGYEAVGAAAQSSTSIKHGLIDINSASQSDLESLKGIGPVLAKKIVDGRPYKSKDELARRHIIPQSEYGKIKDQVIAHHI